MRIYEKLSLFCFKNYKTAHFVGKLLTKLLTKWPLKHIDCFRRQFLLVSQLRNFLSEFQNFLKLPSSFLRVGSWQEREMQTQDNTEKCYRRRNRRIWLKTSPRPSKLKLTHQRINLEYTNNKRPSKSSLPYVPKPSKLLLPTDFSDPCLLQLFGFRNSTQLHPPMNGSFQYFLTAPNSHFTLRMGMVNVWAINLSRIWR